MTIGTDAVMKVRQFIYETFPIAKTQELPDTAELLESGVIDSLGILEVVTFLESEFGIQIADEDLLGGDFSTIESIAALAMSKGEA